MAAADSVRKLPFARYQHLRLRQRRPGNTYPAEQPSERIDYILVSREFRVRSTTVPVTLASDHRPVVADLLLERRD